MLRDPRPLLILALGASATIPALAVAPAELLPADAITVHDTLPVGAPQLRLDRAPARQAMLSDAPALRRLEDRWDDGRDRRWVWRFDEATGRPYSARLPGLPWAEVDALVDDLAHTLGPVHLEPVATHTSTEGQHPRRVRTWRQTHDGLPLFGTELAVFAQGDRVHFVRTALADAPTLPAPAGATLWWPERLSDVPGKGWAPATWHEADDIVTVRHIDGHVLARWTNRHAATVTQTFEARTIGDSLVEAGMPDVAADDGGGPVYTDVDGIHGASDPYDLRLEGERLVVRDVLSGNATPEVTGVEGDITLAFSDDLDPAVADTWGHLKIVEAWLEDRNSEHAILDIQVVDTVNMNRTCNAYYTSGTVNFFRAGGRCANTGRIADVIYHEYGHGVHHYGLLAGGFAGDLSEGTADYVSATILDDPRVGLGFYGGTSTLRNIDPDRVYPRDFRGQVHNDGLIWASFLWNLRADWINTYGDEDGRRRTDALMLGAMAQGPTMTTVGDAVILADDDNGDLSDGTPHGCQLVELLDQHGLGPGSLGVVVIDHEPLEHASSFSDGYPLSFGVFDATPDCSGIDLDSVALWWTLDPVDDEDASDPFAIGTEGDPNGVGVTEWTSAAGARWHRLELTSADDVTFEGTVPRLLATTTVRYFIEVRSDDATERLTTHDGARSRVYGFRVGDRERVSCEGFEGDTSGWEHGPGTPFEGPNSAWEDQWAVGAPAEALWMPDAAYEGTAIVATNLEGNYRNQNVQYLRSPSLEVPAEGRMQMLAFRRWLTVEDSQFDKARIYVNEDLTWEQPGTAGGVDHTLDRRWNLFELDMAHRAGESIQLTWTLRSDPGLEYGGWALDDICMVRLADLPRHHRVTGLTATVNEDRSVELSWENPWIAPLDELVVVRTRGRDPVGHGEGLRVHHDTAPDAAVGVVITDTETEACAPYRYAVFVKGDGVWYEDVVAGENLAEAQIPCDETEDPDPPDPVDATPDGARGEVDPYALPDLPACACSASTAPTGGSLVGLLGALALVLWRRRR